MKKNLMESYLEISRQAATVSLDRKGLAGMGYLNNPIWIRRVA